MKKSMLLKMTVLTALLGTSTSAFAKFPYWDEPVQEKKAPVTMKEFACKLSDYHAKRFAKFSQAQRKNAFAYFEKEKVTPDDAVDQVACEEGLRR